MIGRAGRGGSVQGKDLRVIYDRSDLETPTDKRWGGLDYSLVVVHGEETRRGESWPTRL